MTDPHCPLAVLLHDHVCRDRDGNPLDGRERACYHGSRVQVLHGSVIEQAEKIVAAHQLTVRGEQIIARLFGEGSEA